MLRASTALCLLLLASAPIQAQTVRSSDGKASVHRMEITSGLTQSVRYFGTAVTAEEAATLRDMERLENELNYTRNLTDLKQQYVASERVLEPQRRLARLQAYNSEIYPAGYVGPVYAGSAYDLAYGVRPVRSALGYAAYVNPYLSPAVSPIVGTPFIRPASYEVGPEVGYVNPVKTALAGVLAQQATPEYAASVERARERAVLRTSVSPTLRTAFNVPGPAEARRERDRIRAVAGEIEKPSAGVVITLTTGEKLTGKRMTEQKDWVVLERNEGGRVRIRLSEVSRIEESATPGIRGASD